MLPSVLPPACAELARFGRVDGKGLLGDSRRLGDGTGGPSPVWGAVTANRLPDELGIGITDVGCEAGSEADKYPRATMLRWRDDLYRRLKAHRSRAGRAPENIAFSGIKG